MEGLEVREGRGTTLICGWLLSGIGFQGVFGGPDRDRTDDLFHAMELAKC